MVNILRETSNTAHNVYPFWNNYTVYLLDMEKHDNELLLPLSFSLESTLYRTGSTPPSKTTGLTCITAVTKAASQKKHFLPRCWQESKKTFTASIHIYVNQ